MSSRKKLFIILLCLSVAVIAAPVIVLFTVKPEGAAADCCFVVAIAGICLLTANCVTYAINGKREKRSGEVLAAFKNLGDGVYVQAICGSKKRDGSDGAKNATSFACAMFFAATAGAGVYALTDARSQMEFVIVGNEMYGSEIKQSAFIGYKYAMNEDTRTSYKSADKQPASIGYSQAADYGLKASFQPVYKGWFARHTITRQAGRLIMTGADGQSYISFDLKSCSANEKKLLNVLEQMFGAPTITQN